ncbi:hypothetical protein V0R50_24450, partial [Pseudomonas sp. 148P]
ATVGKPSAPVKTAWQSALLGVASGNSRSPSPPGEDRVLVGLCIVLPVATVGKPSAPVKTAWQSALLGVASGNSGEGVRADEVAGRFPAGAPLRWATSVDGVASGNTPYH